LLDEIAETTQHLYLEPTMSIETLRDDLKGLKEATRAMPDLTTSGDIRKFMKSTLVPFVEALVDEVAEMDGVMADLIEGAEDILQPETAGVFADLIIGGRLLAAKLRELSPTGADPKLDVAIVAFLERSTLAEQLLEEIAVVSADDEEDDEDAEAADEDDDEPDAASEGVE
jgi:hypothetical protein